MDAADKATETSRIVAAILRPHATLRIVEEARVLGRTSIVAALDLLRPAVVPAGECVDVLVAAAEVLVGWGRSEEAHDLLTLSLGHGGPASDILVSIARRCREMGEWGRVRHWLAASLPQHSADAALVFEMAEAEEALGYPSCASALAAAAAGLPIREPLALAATGKRLDDRGRVDLARAAYEQAFAAGNRDLDLVVNLCGLLNRTRAYDRLVDFAADSGLDGQPEAQRVTRMFAAQGRLARSALPAMAMAEAARREEQSHWLSATGTLAYLRDAIRAAKPFSWIRLSDGEARFFLHAFPPTRLDLPAEEGFAAAAVLWDNWFGQPLEDVDPALLDDLSIQLDAAIAAADLLGITSTDRLSGDINHLGYLSALELLIADRWATADRHYSDALVNYQIGGIDPRLETLLADLPFLGVISPHPTLAARLQAYFGIADVASYDIPGESRLQREREKADRGTHFPSAYDAILRDLRVPFPGAVFIVAGGILGKVYCQRIKQLGGIALDVGAIVDAWMGHNTRGSILDHAMTFELPAIAGEIKAV